jgi:hypothetical protein
VVAFQNYKTKSINIGIWDSVELEWNVTTPTTFEETVYMWDLARVGDEVWMLEKNGMAARAVKLLDDGQWETFAEYNPSSQANDNFFIDNALPEVFILSVDDRVTLGEDGGVYSVAVPVPEPATMSLLAISGIALIRRRRRA